MPHVELPQAEFKVRLFDVGFPVGDGFIAPNDFCLPYMQECVVFNCVYGFVPFFKKKSLSSEKIECIVSLDYF